MRFEAEQSGGGAALATTALAPTASLHGAMANTLGDLIDGKVPGRTSDTQTTIFDATGLYILDLAAAKVAIDRALAQPG